MSLRIFSNFMGFGGRHAEIDHSDPMQLARVSFRDRRYKAMASLVYFFDFLYAGVVDHGHTSAQVNMRVSQTHAFIHGLNCGDIITKQERDRLCAAAISVGFGTNYKDPEKAK